ncbi:DNA polymerase sigma, partial [Globisporangium splendens]
MSIVVPEHNPFDHALQLVAQKQYAAAIPFLTEALNATSSSSGSGLGSSSNAAVQHQSKLKLYFQRGNCYLAAQKYKQAVEDFTQVISLTPKNAQLFAKRGKAFAHLNQYHAALSDYNEAISISASSNGYGYAGPSANRAELRGLYLARSKVHRGMNSMSLAFEDLQRAENAGGDRDPEVYYQRAQLYTQCRQDELALKDQTKFLKLQEEVAHQELNADKHASSSGDARDRIQEMRLQRARILRQLAAEKDVQQRLDGEVVTTEEGGRSSTVITSDQRNRHHPTGYCSAEAIDLVLQVIDDYTQVLEMDPENTEVLRFRGDAYCLIDKYDKALADFAQALELEPHDFAVHMSRAKLYQQQNDLQKAIDEITSVLQVNGFFMDALFFRAKLFEQVGDIDKAKRDYTSLINAHYDVRGDAATSNNELANEKTPLLSKGSSNSSSSSRAFNSKSPQAVFKPAKIISDHTVQALLFRARLSVQTNQFDDAIADYNCILASDPAHFDAQLELPDTESKKKAFEEKAHLDAIEWVKEAQLREEEARKQAQANGSAAATSSSKSKKKKKKKRKKRPTQTEYVLLEDEEDDEAFARDHGDSSPHEEADNTVVVAERLVEEESSVAVVVIEEESEHNFTESVAVSSSLNAAVSVVVTRDEACESMWEQLEDQMDSEEVNQEDERVETHNLVTDLHDEAAERGEEEQEEAAGDDENSTKSNPQSEDGGNDDGGDDTGDDPSEDGPNDSAATDASGTNTTTIREVLVDEKYLKKRQKQLEKLRENFLEVCASRDKAGIEQALERAERKQMIESLSDEVHQARAVLEELASEVVDASSVPKAQEPTHLSPDNSAVVESTTKTAVRPVIPSPSAKEAPQKDQGEDASRDVAVAGSTHKPPPSLVIRPIAYGQALQLAEQSQQQFLQHQRLLQEKDAEIAHLRQLLAQAQQRNESTELLDELENDDGGRFASLRTDFPHEELRARESRVDVLVDWLAPNDDSDHTRRKILAFVHRIVESANLALGTPVLFFPTGSFPMKTYLPTADLDVCLLLPNEMEQTWYFPVLHALCLAGSSGVAASDGGSLNGSPNASKLSSAASGTSAASFSSSSSAGNTVRNVTFVNADVRVIKCTIDNVSVDLTANRVGALGALMLLDAMDAQVGQAHLLKKSLVLIKAWCIHESNTYTASSGSSTSPYSMGPAGGAAAATSPNTNAGPHSVLGSSHGAFSTYAINTVVMGLFNQYGAKITHPLQALFLFLDRMAEFPWHEAAMTLHGPIALNVLAATSSLTHVMKKRQQYHAKQQSMPNNNNNSNRDARRDELYNAKLSVDDVEHIRGRIYDQFGGFDVSMTATGGFKAAMFPIRVCNIVDPMDEKNNLARSVSVDWFPSMKRAFRLGRNRLAQLLATADSNLNSSSEPFDALDDFFVHCWKSYGRGDGWRPDLLVHPRQVWHKKVSAPPATNNSSSSNSNGSQSDEQRWQSILPELVVPPSAYQQVPQGAAALYQTQYIPQQHPYPTQHQYPAYGAHSHSQQRAAALVTSEAIPFQPLHHHHAQQQHASRAFDSSSKSSPLKLSPPGRHQQQSPGGGAYVHAGASKALRRFDSPPSYAASK